MAERADSWWSATAWPGSGPSRKSWPAGGRDSFDITVFGDEPYGNYNRILLSNVLAGIDDPAEIYLNTLDWYTDNGIDLRAGVRVVRLDTLRASGARRRRHVAALRQADPGHRQPVVLPADDRTVGR